MEIEEIINNVKVYGLEDSVKASKYPMSIDIKKCNYEITNTVNSLAKNPSGTGHNNFLLGIVVQFDLSFTIKAWTEAERYHFMDIISSQSTIHKITKMDIKKACMNYVTDVAINNVNEIIDEYNANPTNENYLKVLYNVPVGLRLTARMTTNYLQLKTIYNQRKNHKLEEWRTFCKWIETLPHSEWIIENKDGFLININNYYIITSIKNDKTMYFSVDTYGKYGFSDNFEDSIRFTNKENIRNYENILSTLGFDYKVQKVTVKSFIEEIKNEI